MGSTLVGKGPADYIDEAASPLTQAKFKERLFAFLGDQGSPLTLNDSQVQVLFEISDEFSRRVVAIANMKKDSLARDWGRRETLMKSVKTQLNPLLRSLRKKSSEPQFPNTALLAKLTAGQLQILLDGLALVRRHQRLHKTMLKALSPKQFQNEYVGQLDYYIRKHALPASPQLQRDMLLAATLAAAKISPAHGRPDLLPTVGMARLRAKRAIEKAYPAYEGEDTLDYDDGPVFQTQPKKRQA